MSSEPNASAATGAPTEREAAAIEEVKTSTTEQNAPADDVDEPEGADTDSADDDNEQEDDAQKRRPSRTKRLQAKVQALTIQLEHEQRRNGASSKSDGKPPSEADFGGDYSAFERAQRQFDVEEAVRRVRAEDDRKANEAKASELSDARASLYRERAAEAKSTLTDFDKVLESARNERVRDDISDFIQESEKGPHLAYHLAKHPEQLRDINGLSPVQAMRELARIEARLSTPAPKRQTSAPPPVRRLSGGASPAPTPGKTMSDYERWRNSEG